MEYVRITCGLGSSVSEEFTVCIFRRHSEDGDILSLQNSIHSMLFCICVEGNNLSVFWIEMTSLNWRGTGFGLNSCFGRMILHVTFYRNMISFSVNHKFSSAYSAISDTPCGHFWANKFLRTCRVIKVPIPTYICISC